MIFEVASLSCVSEFKASGVLDGGDKCFDGPPHDRQCVSMSAALLAMAKLALSLAS
jgi:hypothetical protein